MWQAVAAAAILIGIVLAPILVDSVRAAPRKGERAARFEAYRSRSESK
jgi:hypothetical protein